MLHNYNFKFECGLSLDPAVDSAESRALFAGQCLVQTLHCKQQDMKG